MREHVAREPNDKPGQEMSYQQWEERRTYKRYPSDLPVRFAEPGGDQPEGRQGNVTNVSRGGVFIRTKTPALPGTVLELCIGVVTPFGEERELKVSAEVVWINEDLGEEGMGLRFTQIDRHSQYALLACTYRGEG
ncbi:MAG: hypothetical protein AMK75_00590 [Planctomycetes bacterium SM23_65]|nr:MAG: hypothetical protein AMK75_00590 [Planctomycetes bacterium SM23_65]